MKSELRTIREQMKSDFKAVMSALAIQRDVIKAMAAQLAAQQEVLEGYITRTDERLGKLIAFVEPFDDWRETVDSRLDALEKKTAS